MKKKNKKEKVYKVVDLQDCNFMDDTHDEPMTLKDLRERFWDLDEGRSIKYSQFTKGYIEELWVVDIVEVKVK